MGDGELDLVKLVAVLDGDLLVPTPDAASKPGTCEVVEPEQLLVAMHEDEVGLAFPAFTGRDAFLGWRPEGGTVASRAGWAVAELAAVDEQGRLVIDVAGPESMVVPTEVLRSLLDARGVGADPAAGASMLVAASSEPLPAELGVTVGAVLRAEPTVVAAHLVVLDDGTGGPGRCVAVVLADGADPTAVMPGLVEAVSEAAPDAAGLTFIVVEGELASSVAASGTDVRSS